MRALLLFLSISTATANAAIQISPERPLIDPHPAAPQSGSIPAAVATDGSNFLVIWIGSGGLMATIVSDAGDVPTLPRGPQIPSGSQSSFSEISAVWTGSVYLVTWSSADNLPAMFAATLSRDGTLVREPYVVARNAGTRSGALASGARGAFQAYVRNDVLQWKGALFDEQGALIAADISLPSPASSADWVDGARVASDGDEFAFVWRTADTVPIGTMSTPPPLSQRFDTFHLQRISAAGSLIGAPITIGRLEATQSSFGLASGAGKYAIVATEQHLITPAQTQPMIARFIVDARNATVSALPKIPSQGGDSVIWNGVAFVAYGVSYPPVSSSFSIRTVAFTGEPESAPPQTKPLPTGYPAAFVFMASNGKNIFGAWTQSTGSTVAVYGAVLDSIATSFVVAPFLTALSWSRQFLPAIATSGTESLVVWIDETGGWPAGGLMALRIAADGSPIYTAPFFIATATIDERPVVTFTGTTYLLVWSEATADGGRAVVARSVGRDGALGARMPLGFGWGVTAASNSAMTLIAFGASQGIAGYRFDSRGERLDQQPIIIGSGFNPSAATNGTDFFVAWNVGSDYWQWPSPDYIDVVGARVSAAGAVDAASLPIATGTANQVLAAVGSDGRDYVVFYALLSQQGGLAAKRVLREGQLDGVNATDPGTIVFREATEIWPTRFAMAIAADRTGFWLAWPTDLYPSARIVLVHTDVRGKPNDPMTVISYSGWQPTARVALAQAARGSLQIVYARPVNDGTFAGTTRLFLRFAGEPASHRRAAQH